MQHTEQSVAQWVWEIINSSVAHIHVSGRTESGVYQFPPNVFVGLPDPIRIDRCFKFLIPYGDLAVFFRWLELVVPIAAHHAVWLGPPRATRIADDECFLIEADFELLDPFGSPVWSGELLWKDNKIRQFEAVNLGKAT